MPKKLERTRGELIKVINVHHFEMSDFWSVCPYTFEGVEKRTRKREIVHWRNVGMLWAFMSGMSLQKAGELFDRDHATVIHGIENILTAYEGYGHVELVDIINTIQDNKLSTIFKSDDSNINYAISQVILDSRYSELNF